MWAQSKDKRSAEPLPSLRGVLIIIMILPVMALALALQRFIASGLLLGAVKG